jgi:hypothetical protein
MMRLEELVDQVSEDTHIVFGPGRPEDLEALSRLKVPPKIIEFYRKFEPRDCVELGEVRLWPIRDIVRENSDYVPGADIHPHGYIVFASTICGDPYCFDINEANEAGDVPVVLMSHELYFPEIPSHDIKRLRKKVAVNFEEFLRKFHARSLEKEPLYSHD